MCLRYCADNDIACGRMRETVTERSYEAGGGLAAGPLDLSQSVCGEEEQRKRPHRLCTEGGL